MDADVSLAFGCMMVINRILSIIQPIYLTIGSDQRMPFTGRQDYIILIILFKSIKFIILCSMNKYNRLFNYQFILWGTDVEVDTRWLAFGIWSCLLYIIF